MNPDSPEIRISDHDREQVVAVLRQASGEGRITLDEFSDMAGSVFAAKTRGDLDDVVRSLPLPLGTPPPPTAPSGALPTAAPSPGPTTRSTSPGAASRTIVAVMSGQRRKGRWRVAEQTTAFAFWGGIDLDLRGAVIEGTVVEITAIAIMGGIDITVPEGIPVEMDGFVLMGGSDNRVRDMPALPGAPLIRVTAYGLWGGVSVKSKPNERDKRARSRDRGVDEAGVATDESRHGVPQLLPPPVPTMPLPPPPPWVPAAAPPEAAAPASAPAAAPPPTEPVPVDDREIDAMADAVKAAPAELRSHAAPDGTVTILFSDIESSAEHAERLGDHRWIELLRAHNTLIREQVARFNGTEVKAEGDGFMIAFSSARKALLCAIGIQQTMSMFRREHPETQMRVRIGLHTGEVVRDDGDLFGKNVILAARVAAQARGDEILVSSVVKELTDSGGDLVFDEGREVELRGLARQYRVYLVDWKG